MDWNNRNRLRNIPSLFYRMRNLLQRASHMLYDACCDAVGLSTGFYQWLPLCECGEEAGCMRVTSADSVDCFDGDSWDDFFAV